MRLTCGHGGVIEHLAGKGVTGDEPVGELALMMRPVVGVGVGPVRGAAAILEADGVGCKHGDPGCRQQRPQSLMRVADETSDLAHAQMPLGVVLVEQHDCGTSRLVGPQEERWDLIATPSGVDEALKFVALMLPHWHQRRTRLVDAAWVGRSTVERRGQLATYLSREEHGQRDERRS